MASALESRPYIGTWNDNTKLVQWTPDGLVKINGSSTLPGCPQCKGVIRIQDHLTEVSVDAGTEPGSASCSMTLSFPKHIGDLIMREGDPTLRPGLEIQTYLRGYFPVAGLFDDTSEGVTAGVDTSQPSAVQSNTSNGRGKAIYSADADANRQAAIAANRVTNADQLISIMRPKPSQAAQASIKEAFRILTEENGYTPAFAMAAILQAKKESGWDPKKLNTNAETKQVVAIGFFQLNRIGTSIGGSRPYFREGRVAGTEQETKDHPDKYYNAQDLKTNLERWVASLERSAGMSKAAYNFNLSPAEQFKRIFTSPLGAGDPENREDGGRKIEQLNQRQNAGAAMFGEATWGSVTATWTPTEGSGAFVGPPVLENNVTASSATTTEGLPNVLSYPHYHVFHGVITEVTPSYSGGYVSITLACSGLLHFWEYQRISTSASIFGERAQNSFLNTTLIGNHYNGMHPYAIIYDLWSNAMGAQDGVGWVLDQKSNVSTTSGITEDSLFSLMGKYWRERFGDRFAKLRMHGFSGDLFSSAQAAFLAGQSSDSLSNLIKSRYPSNVAGQSVPDVTSMSKGLGLFKGRKLDSLVAAKNLSGEGIDTVELDMGQMVSFVQSISDMGTVNFFESAYQSKLDIVNTVCGLTGYEFYQDVDGDFVFKPPMYNLDTSSSRVYCIEDIDIVNISFPEGEAIATTARVKGGHFENLMTGAVEGEWGVSGTFVNYPLVAQYGWRPLELETSYLTNPRAMFFYAAAQLDLKNAASTRISITIPLRPEIRPGFPVYIRFMDCFYYINSLSHSLSFGGDCSTTLQGLARREKFNAPGTDAEGINFADTTLPKRILRVLDESKQEYRNVGFPNVVMTLDPTAIDPLFFLVGSDIDDLSNPQTLENLMRAAKDLGLVTRVPGGYRSTSKFGTDSIFYEVESSEELPAGTSMTPPSVTVKVQEAANAYKLDRNTRIANKKVAEEAYAKQLAIVGELRQTLTTTKEPEARESLRAQIEIANDVAQQTLKETLAWDQSATPPSTDLTKLRDLIAFTSRVYQDRRSETDSDVKGASLYLNLLSDKKASFTNGSVPGTYRYYSASHPSPEHQGPSTVTVFRTANGSTNTTISSANPIDPEWDGGPVSSFEDVTGRTVRRMLRRPSKGISVLTGKWSGGETMPTSEIKELSFTGLVVKSQTPISNTVAVPTTTDIGSELRKALVTNNWFNTVSGQQRPVATGDSAHSYWVEGIDSSVWDEFTSQIQKAATEASVNRTSVPFPPFTTPNSSDATLSTFTVPTNTSIAQSKADKIINDGGLFLIDEYAMRQFNANVYLWKEHMSEAKVDPQTIVEVIEAFNSQVCTAFSITNPTSATLPSATVPLTVTEQNVQIPIFPVSDENGYRVIGMYRYGRGVSIDPDGVWDSLAAQDPLSVVDAETLQSLLKTYVQNKSRDPQLELEVLRQIQAANITDADLLNRGLAVQRAGGKTEIGLANWLTSGREGVDYLPVNNMARSLGDIDKQVEGSQPCNCLSMTGFLALENENVEAGNLTEALQRVTRNKVPQWRRVQKTYRGQ